MTSRIGLVVPPLNPTVHDEYRRLLPDAELEIALFSAVDGTLRERLAGYAYQVGDAVDGLRALDLDAVLVACTGCSYGLGVEGDRDLASVAQRRAGTAALTAAGAVARVLRLLGVSSLTLVSPYPDWLTEQAGAFWEQAGLQVRATVPIPGTGGIYDLAPADVLATVDAVLAGDGLAGNGPNHAVLISGTGAPTLDVLDLRSPSSVCPIISSNLAGAWSLLDQLGKRPEAARSHSPALRRLAGLVQSLEADSPDDVATADR